jgi:hypothetical protein
VKKLSDLIPNWEDVLRLEPEQLAGILLEILLEIDGNDRQFFHCGNFFNQFASTQNYPAARGGEVAQATLEAWMYLEREGFLVPRRRRRPLWIRRREVETQPHSAFRPGGDILFP